MLTILFLGALGAGFLWFAVMSLRDFRMGRASRGWPTVPCEVLSSSVNVPDPGVEPNPVYYSIQIEYRYEVAGRAYVGDRYGLTSSLRRRQADEVVASLSPGTRTTCYVDPHDPTKALMVPGGSGAIAGLWIAIVLLFLGLPALALAGYRLYESLKRG